jgi:hypothetical protein
MSRFLPPLTAKDQPLRVLRFFSEVRLVAHVGCHAD